MKLPGAGDKPGDTPLFDASGTLSGTTPVLVLPRAMFRSFLLIENTGASLISVDFGYARAGAVTMSGTSPNLSVASVAVANAGHGYTLPPSVHFFGGGGGDMPYGSTAYLGVPLPDELSPTNPAVAHCVMTGSAPNKSVSSIGIDNPGSGYLCAPLAYLRNNRLDPNGCVAAAAGSGAINLPAGSAALIWNGTTCPTDPLVIVGSSGGSYTVKYMT